MIQNIIFDLGNVLLKFEPMKLVEKYEQDQRNAEIVFMNIFKSREWIELDRGTISEQEAESIIIGRIPQLADVVKKVFEEWISILVPIEENVALLTELVDNNKNLYILSNFHDKAFNIISKKYDFFSKFTGGVISYEVKMIKPDEKIYNEIIDKYKLVKEETLFIDDMSLNVVAARHVGINALLYDSPEQLKEDLKKYEIL